MIAEITRELSAITDAQWWEYLFSRDPMYDRVSAPFRTDLIERAATAGRHAAQDVRQLCPSGDMDALYTRFGVNIREEASYGTDDYIFFASFTKPRLVTLYKGNLEKLQIFLEDNDVEEMPDTHETRELLLAHELYHFYEQEHPDCFPENYRFVSHSFGVFRLQSKLISLSEISAMAFAKELTGSAVNPCVLNILLLMPHDAQKATGMFYKLQKQMSTF